MESKALPIHSLSEQLTEIAKQYRIESYLNEAIEFTRTRNCGS